MTTVTIGGTEIQYQDFSITIPTSSVDVAPSATVTTTAVESIGANDTLTITIDGTVKFEGKTRSGGTKSELGGRQVKAAHGARDLFEDTVSLSLTSPTTDEVLQAAIDAADTTGFTLSYSGSGVALGNDYSVSDRSVKRVFRDMMDRTSRVWWVDPAGSTIHVQPRGGRGQWQAINTRDDKATLTQYDSGDVDTVRNSVTVVGTGDEAVRETVEDTNSISTYGRRPGNSPYNVAYVTTQSEAQSYAQELLVPDPLPSGTLVAGSNVGDVTQPLANYTIDLTDPGKDVDATGLVIESQTIEQGRAELEVGAGSGVSLEEVNRQSKSQDDTTEPGSVYNSDRIADGAIQEEKLVDGSVIESKLADLAVSLNKVDFDAIDETKIQDGAVRTPQLFAEAVTAEKLNTELARANRLLAGEIEALDIATDTLTANQIDTLNLETAQLEIGTDAGAQIQFSVDSSSSLNYLDMDPTNDAARIGYNNRFDSVWAFGIDGSIVRATGSGAADPLRIPLPDGDTAIYATVANSTSKIQPETDNAGALGGEINRWSTVRSYNAAIEETVNANEVLPQNGSNTGNVGVTGNYWEGMRANAYFEESPLPMDGTRASVDLAELLESDWYDPPAYVAEGTRAKQGQVEGGLASASVGDGTEEGVELGTLSNYLLSVCQKQQEVLNEQADRIDDLESRIADLEDGQ